MKKEAKQGRPLCRMLGTALAVWAVLLGVVWCARKWGSAVVFLLFALLAVGGAVVFLLRHGHGRFLRRGCAAACVLSLCLSLLPVQAAAVSGSLSDTNIGMSDVLTEGTAPSGSSGSGGTGSSGGWTASGTTITGSVKPGYTSETSGCTDKTTTYYYFSSATTTLTLTNNSGEAAILSFSYTAPDPGTISIDGGAAQKSGGTFSKELGVGESVSVALTTVSSPDSTTDTLNQEKYAASTSLRDVSLQPLDADASVTLLPAIRGGSYTAKTGSVDLTVGETYTYPISTEYTFTVAVEEGYIFDGWYLNDVNVSRDTTYSCSFSGDNNTIQPKFGLDPEVNPFLSIATVIGSDEMSDAFLEVDEDFIHIAAGCRSTTAGDSTINNDYGPQETFPYREWTSDGSAIQSSWSGEIEGDNQIDLGYSNARAWLYSDVIRIKAIQPCVLTFDLSLAISPLTKGLFADASSFPNAGVHAYYYATNLSSVNTSTITANGTQIPTGEQEANYTGQQRVVLSEGDYLYIYCIAEALNSSLRSNGYVTDTATYSATISGVTIEKNETTYTLTVGNQDNTGAALDAGSVRLNGVVQSVSNGSYTTEMSGGAAITLTAGTAPSGYTFIGWHNATTGEYRYEAEYDLALTQSMDVYALYVPAMTITTGGANGYESATYAYRNLSGATVTPNGQYVARNSDCTAFYTTLADAFAGTDTVVLLAGDTISGDLTIPTGKTLVIPYRLADPGSVEPEQVTSPATMTNYCAVTYTGGTLTVDGTLVVSGAQAGNSPMGVTSGGIGYLAMDDSADMTVNGVLSVSGLIRGGSRITVNSGADVYELMVIADFRSLLLTESFLRKEQVFPFNNFYIKNIEEVPVTYYAGADLYARYSMRLQGMDTNTTENIPVIAASDALFNVTQGTFTKTFDLSTDKTTYCLDEGAVGSTGNFSITMTYSKSGISQTMTVDTADYIVPLNAGFQIQVDGNLTVNSDFKFLPGAVLSVGETGTCTVASGKNVFFYRLNDYDNRRGGSGTTYQGFGSSGYPVSARNFPAGGYSHPNINTVGSARLNVDGQMIVNGGLYVTDMLCEAAYSSGYKDNGYNVLTGTGTIDFSNASTSTTYVEEGMQASGSNDPQYVQVTVTPIAGLLRDAAADDPASYFAFSAGRVYYGAYRPVDGGIYVWSNTPFTQVATIYTSEGAGQSFITLADAVEEYNVNDGGYIQLTADVKEGVTIGENVYLDLAGHTLDGTVTITDGTLYGMDSTTDNYNGEKAGTITTVTGTPEAVFQTDDIKSDDANKYYRYVAIPDNDGGYSFHRFNISVTGYRFELATNTPECALFFIAQFRGDEAVLEYLQSLGITLTENNQAFSDSVQIADGADSPMLNKTDNGYSFEAYLLRAFSENNQDRYTDPIEAVAVATFEGDNNFTSEPQSLSYLDAWNKVDKITPEHQERLDAFLANLGINTEPDT